MVVDGPEHSSPVDVPNIDLDPDHAADEVIAPFPRAARDDREHSREASRANLASDAELARAAALDPAMAAVLEAAARGEFDDRPAAARDSAELTASHSREAAHNENDSQDHEAAATESEAKALRESIKVSPLPGKEPVPALDPGHPEFQSIVRQSVVEQIRAHAEENTGIEVCGVLVGTVYENPQASFVYIDGMIRGDGSSGRSTQVTFTAETWQNIHKAMEERHPGKRIIGWYHTHPGFGIFLSEMDLFIQRHFFNAPWQVAFVFDPKGRDAGMFAWRQAQVRRVDFVLDDESGENGAGGAAAALASLPAAGSTSLMPTFHEEPSAPINSATLEELVDRVRSLEGRVKWLLTGFAVLVVVAIIWPLIVGVVMPAVRPAPANSATPGGTGPDANFPVMPSDRPRR